MENYFKKERKVQPNPVNKFHSLGIYYCKTGEYIKAIECFKEVLIIDPDHLDSKNKIEFLVKKLEEKEDHLNGENLLESNNIKEQGKITFVNIPKNEKIVKKHERLSDSEIKHYQNILQLYGKHGSIGFPKKDTYLQKSSPLIRVRSCNITKYMLYFHHDQTITIRI